MDRAEEKTLKYYNDHAQEWTSNAHFRFGNEMQKFHGILPSGKILEVGSGSGLDAQNLISLGYDYVGVDASEGLLNVAKDRNPGAILKLVRAQDLIGSFEKNTFDGFWTVNTLLHVPRKEIDATLEGIREIVKDNGIGFIVIKQGRGEREDKLGRMFTYYLQPGFSRLLQKHGFEILEKDMEPIEGQAAWLKFFVKVKK